MRPKLISAREAVDLIPDSDTITISGFVDIGVPDELLCAIEDRL